MSLTVRCKNLSLNFRVKQKLAAVEKQVVYISSCYKAALSGCLVFVKNISYLWSIYSQNRYQLVRYYVFFKDTFKKTN